MCVGCSESADEPYACKGTDYDELSRWAEEDMKLSVNSTTASHGDEAQAKGAALLARATKG